jgi:mono/diheme cytochrome c family protein
MTRRYIAFRLLWALLLAAASDSITQAQDAQAPDFAQHVQPILESKCHSCHGSKKQTSDLRLDRKTDAFRGGAGGPAIVPGKPDESPLLERILSDEPEFRMPPKGEKLSAQEIAHIRDWIAAGAAWPESASTANSARAHWAFQPPRRPPIPDTSHPALARNPIDRFIHARLDAAGLKPAPEADRITLIRRLYLDLIGLPPQPEEIQVLLADHRPDALERLVDQLLASPRHGERWGRHWLDAARYADSDGFEKDKPRYIWFYRDWVIRAFNRDLPYNDFLIHQLAGDLLPGATQEEIIATGYLRNSMVNEEGGIDPEQFRMEAMFDRMDAIGKGILGLTIQCCQCHSHKYDPITQEEYYRLFAFLNNDDEPARVAYTTDQTMRIESLRREIAGIESMLRDANAGWEDQMARWEDRLKSEPQPEWTTLQAPFEDISTGGQKYLLQSDGSYLAQGYAPTKHTAKVTVGTKLPRITAVRLELLNDPNLPGFGPGRSFKGTCALTEFNLEVAPASTPADRKPAKFKEAFADFEQPPETPLEPNFEDKSNRKRITGPAAYAIDGKDETAWGMDAGPGRRNVPRQIVFILENPIENPDAGEIQLTFALAQNHGGWNSDDLMTNNLGRFRISVTGGMPAAVDRLPPRIQQILATPRSSRSEAQTLALFSHFRTTVPDWKDANDRIEALWREHPEGTTTLTLAARPGGRITSVLRRGDFLKPTKTVSAGVPAILNPLPESAENESEANRMTLARWITSNEAPTTARVFVNRVWQSYFGTGLVSTPEDFGTQGDRPSHPELLDWLACEFMDSGWSIKALHRLITSSATYRQSSRVEPDQLALDPMNRLLARGPRFRVEGEIVRDIQLAAAGLLVEKLGGKAVMPPAPLYLFQPPASYAPFPWVEETGPDRYRRAVYTWRRRSTPYPMLATFDVPPGETACVRRQRSNTPLQALTSLNETVSMESARALAARMLSRGGSLDADRLAYGFQICTSRPPTSSELALLENFLKKQIERLAEGWLNPWEIATGEPRSQPQLLPSGATPTQLGAYTLVARVLLNLDETITKE